MSNKKMKIVSISIEPELHESLKTAATKAGWTTSKLARNLFTKYLPSNGETPVVLRVPAQFKDDPAGLKAWLDAKVVTIVKSFSEDGNDGQN
jgi:hypothetical protein